MTSVATFFTGFAAAFFAIYSGLMFQMKDRTRFQTLLAVLFVFWAIACTKDLLLAIPISDHHRMLKAVTLMDGWLSITFMLFLFELTMPGWTTIRRVFLISIPFLMFLVAYMMTESGMLLNVYVIFLVIMLVIVMTISVIKARKYIQFLRENYSNLEDIDISWIYIIILCIGVNHSAWMFIMWYDNPITDTFYYIGTVLMWWGMMQKTVYFKPINWEKLGQDQQIRQPNYSFAQTLNDVMENEKPYLNSDYKLEDLAQRLGTNRTYLSDYLHAVKKVAFYDFINQLRVTKKSIPLLKAHPEYSIDQVASASGFNSTTTFRRAFLKYAGTTPSAFREQLKSK